MEGRRLEAGVGVLERESWKSGGWDGDEGEGEDEDADADGERERDEAEGVGVMTSSRHCGELARIELSASLRGWEDVGGLVDWNA